MSNKDGVANIKYLVASKLTMDAEGAASEAKDAKKVVPQTANATTDVYFDEYMKKSIEILKLLPENSEEQSAPTDEKPSTSTNKKQHTLKDIENYVIYARNVRFNFIASFDTLLKGRLQINPDRKEIKDVYAITIIAWVLFLASLSMDLMPLHSGYEMFKYVYLFNENDVIKNLGYINFETVLEALFSWSDDINMQKLQTAFVYGLLYENTPLILQDNVTFENGAGI